MGDLCSHGAPYGCPICDEPPPEKMLMTRAALDTIAHIDRVREYISQVRNLLFERGQVHDQSKLEEPERAVFEEYTNKLRHTDYGSPEYKGFLEAMAPALAHHYHHNTHHPEHYPMGVDDMDLLDLVEMFCDWKAATERTKNGDLTKSIEMNKERFDMTPQLTRIFLNTALRLGW